MGKVWVLDTETKGTGAQMVPLEKKASGPAPRNGPVVVEPKRVREPAPPEPRQPPRFKVVDAMSRQVLAEDTGTRATVDLLEGIRSVVDVSIWVWDHEADDWRLLRIDERKALWALRGRQ